MRWRDRRIPWPLAMVLVVVLSPLAGVGLAVLTMIVMERLT